MPKHKRTITSIAADKKHGMTLRELAQFVQDAMSADADQDVTVKIDATWRQSIKQISVTDTYISERGPDGL